MSSSTEGAAFAARLAAAGLEATDRSEENDRTAGALRRMAGQIKMARNNAAISAAAAEAKRDPDQTDMFL